MNASTVRRVKDDVLILGMMAGILLLGVYEYQQDGLTQWTAYLIGFGILGFTGRLLLSIGTSERFPQITVQRRVLYAEGDEELLEEFREEFSGEMNVFHAIRSLLFLPGTVLEELAHGSAARLLEVPVLAIVFPLDDRELGFIEINEEQATPREMQLIKAATLVYLLPALYLFTFAFTSDGIHLLPMIPALLFLGTAIPDQVQEAIF
jgi:hypothetical protein